MVIGPAALYGGAGVGHGQTVSLPANCMRRLPITAYVIIVLICLQGDHASYEVPQCLLGVYTAAIVILQWSHRY